ncbi:Response regulator receiver domain-containing protein [Cnuella takakiae]|uniref:Response regulator receiver domain-containing protein n=1 Tax=Cnuella takakiae TaxID=1302690 RepID=A0A1M5IDD4_9BACT|nr:response regulator [Cnuella takakiae]OLY90810.1 hypothetical protein BUE76_02030 [Cnuella takakiae]SHG26388.1 Response regulator receiver domain-containing protein [Cnuella takakiae]
MQPPYPLLIVDDDPEERYLLQLALNDIGWPDAALYFHSAEAALRHLALLPPGQYPSVLLLDYHMPGINGQQMLELLKESQSFQHLPVIIYSTHLTAVLKEKLLRSGVLHCRSKVQRYAEAIEFAQWLRQLHYRTATQPSGATPGTAI